MKAIVLKRFGGPEHFELQDVPLPEPKDNELLIQIKACGFNPIDFQMRQGDGESKLMTSQILGRELSGIVIKENSHGAFKEGDEVFAYAGSLGSNGTYAEYVALPQQLVARKPACLSFWEAAAVPMASLTALQCVERIQITTGDSILIAGGSGGVGSVLIRLLQLKGTFHIVSFAGNEHSRAILKQLQLPDDAIINYRVPNLLTNVMNANAGQSYDHCIDIVGGSMSDICSEALKVNGCYADIAALGTTSSRNLLFDKAATVYNISNYARASFGDAASWSYYGSKLAYLSRLLDEHKISPPAIHYVGDLNTQTVAEAHLLMEKNLSGGRKLVMAINS